MYVALPGSNFSTCGPTSDPCASLAVALANAKENDSIVVRAGVSLSGPDNTNLLISLAGLSVSGEDQTSSVRGDGAIVFVTDVALEIGNQPTFQNLLIVDGVMSLGACGASVTGVHFVGSAAGMAGGIRYSGRVPVNEQMRGLTLERVVFTRNSLVVNSGSVALTGVQFEGSSTMTVQGAIQLSGTVGLRGVQVSSQSWPAAVVDSDAAGWICLEGGSFGLGLGSYVIDSRGGSVVSLVQCTVSGNGGGVRVRGGGLGIEGGEFKGGFDVPFIDAANATVTIQNVSFSDHQNSECISCRSGAFVHAADCTFRGNSNPVFASLVTVNLGCTLQIDGAPSDMSLNSFPEITCMGGSVVLGQAWNEFVECSDGCSWAYCDSARAHHWSGYALAMLVFGVVGLVAILSVLGWWLWTVHRKRLLRRLEYSDIQGGNDSADDL